MSCKTKNKMAESAEPEGVYYGLPNKENTSIKFLPYKEIMKESPNIIDGTLGHGKSFASNITTINMINSILKNAEKKLIFTDPKA